MEPFNLEQFKQGLPSKMRDRHVEVIAAEAERKTIVADYTNLKAENAELNALIDSREQLNAASISDLELECMKLERANARLREVLAGLVKSHEEWNDQISRVVGRPVNWTDSYLDEARHVLSNASRQESEGFPARDCSHDISSK